MFLAVAIGAQENALIELGSNFLKACAMRGGQVEVLLRGIHMVEFKTANVLVVATRAAFPAFVLHGL